MEQLWPILAAFSFLLAVAASALALRAARALVEERRVREEALQSLRNDLNEACSGLIRLAERLRQGEGRAEQLSRRIDELGLRQQQVDQAEPEGRTLQQAIRLARRGASVEELMEVCGLARGEAELVAMIHRTNPPSR